MQQAGRGFVGQKPGTAYVAFSGKCLGEEKGTPTPSSMSTLTHNRWAALARMRIHRTHRFHKKEIYSSHELKKKGTSFI